MSILITLIYSVKTEKAMALHSSTLAWKIPWPEEPERLQSMESLRVGHHWATSLSLFTFMHWRRKWQPTPVFLLGESQGRRSLVCCRLWGHTVGHDWSDLAAAGAVVKNLPAKARDIRDQGFISESGRLSGVGNATHSSVLALKIPCTEESGRLLPMGPKESNTTEWLSARAHTHTHTRARLV